MAQQTQHLYEFGPFRLDSAKRLLFRGGEPLQLTPKCLEILMALVDRSGEVVSKDELMRQVWPDTIVEEGNLTYNISILRKALGERAGEHKCIVTVPGRGYQFVAAVSEVRHEGEEAAQAKSDSGDAYEAKAHRLPEAEQQEATASGHGSEGDPLDASNINAIGQAARKTPDRVARRELVLIAIALLVAALVIGAVYLLFGRSGQRPNGAATQKLISMVAVLPLVNGSGDADMEYLSDGISESLINSLSQLPGLKVIARSSSFKYKGKEVDPQDAARALGVEAIVTGRVLQRGDSLIISVEFVDARDKTQVWGEQYNRHATDLLALQSEISREIAAKLRLKLTTGEQQRLVRRETVNPQAYEMLLKGRFYWNKGGTENRRKAVEYNQQAIAVDPAYGLAYAELSNRYHTLVTSSVLDPKEFMPKAEAAAYKALELDDGLAEAHLALARIKLTAWDWAAAGREFNLAMELNPNLARARSHYALYLAFMGRHDEAIAESKRARELDPLSLFANWGVGYQLLLARRNDQAIEAAKKMLELDQNSPEAHALLGYAYEAKGQYPEAIAVYQKAIKLGDRSPDIEIYLGTAYARAGQREKARAILNRLEAGKVYVSHGALAALYVELSEREKAFALLERAYAAHDGQLHFLGVDPHLDPLRSDPRFTDLMRRVGLPQ
jgi:TolB-like protein/DNA-binding winged helix-turn-helix (wHTH) protein/Flp pilus assembly protein TadD